MEVGVTVSLFNGRIVISPEEHCTSMIRLALYAAGEVAGGLHGANRLTIR